MTKRENFEAIRNLIIDNAELVAFIDHELELLNKKYSSKKETKVQTENKSILDLLKSALEEIGEPATVSTILTHPSVSEYVTVKGKCLSNQKVSRILNDAIDTNNGIAKSVIKKVSYFSLA